MTCAVALLAVFLQMPCSCDTKRSVADELKFADIVFQGTLRSVAVPDWDGTSGRTPPQEHTFTVKRSWKGVDQPSVVIATMPLSDCSFTFIVGEEYLVYADHDPMHPRVYLATVCSRTAPIAKAGEDLKKLPEPKHTFGN